VVRTYKDYWTFGFVNNAKYYKMKIVRLIAIIGMVVLSGVSYSQVGIGTGTPTPDASAMLDVQSTTKGMLIPRMDEDAKNAISSPAEGLLIYQTDGTDGFYFYHGSSWTAIGGSSQWTASGSDIYYNTGKVGIGTSTPSQKLQIHGAASAPATSGTTPNGNFTLSNSTTFSSLFFGAYSTIPYGNWIQISSRNDLGIEFPLILQPNGGKLGIGIAAPSSAIHNYENNTSTTAAGLTLEQAGEGDVIIQFLRTSKRRWVMGIDNDDKYFKISPASDLANSVLAIHTNGNLGIGTATPTTKLHVDGSFKITQITHELTDAAPTEAQFTAANGTVAANTAGAGYKFVVKDTSSGDLYIVESNGSNWYYTEMTQAAAAK
jgi:hypothetical protein